MSTGASAAAMRAALLPLLATGAMGGTLGPGKGPWVVEAPEKHGVAQSALDEAKALLFKDAPTRSCMIVIKDGILIYESYSRKRGNTTNHPAASMTKTLGAMIVGSAVGAGTIDIDADITQTYGVRSPKKYPVTTRQIMSQALAGADGPGQSWSYDATGFEWVNHLPHIVKNATGQKAGAIWKTVFEEPLGLSKHFSWGGTPWSDPNQVWSTGASGTCRDWARIGQLLLNKGRWAGEEKELLPAEYVRQMSTPATHFAPFNYYANTCYGLLTWVNENQDTTLYPPKPGTGDSGCLVPIKKPLPDGDVPPPSSPRNSFFLGGAAGQVVQMYPDQNIVAVTMGDSENIKLGDLHVSTVLSQAVWCAALGKCAPPTPVPPPATLFSCFNNQCESSKKGLDKAACENSCG